MQTVKIGDINSFEKRIKQLKVRYKANRLKQAAQYEAIASKPITKAEAENHWHESPEAYREWCINQAATIKNSADSYITTIKYYPRLKVFKNSSNSCGFDPSTGKGHSYSWYSLSRVFKGRLILNSYRYSRQTSKHLWNMQSLFRDLGLKYLELEAPCGLQDLDLAFRHIVRQLGNAMIRQKHALKANYRPDITNYWRQLKTLKAIGYKFSAKAVKKTLAAMIQKDTQKRAEARERGKQIRAMRRQV